MENRRYTPKHSERSTTSARTRTSQTPSTRTGQTSMRSERIPRHSRYDADLYDDMPSYTSRSARNGSGRRPQKTPRRKTGCAIASLYFIVILGISACMSLFIIFAANDVLALIKTDRDISVVVPVDTTVAKISKLLDQNGIVNYGMVFRVFNMLKGDGDVIVSAGSYTLNPTMDYGQIVRALTKTTSTTSVKVTIPEGYTVKQIRQTLLDQKVTSTALLDNALNEYPYKHSFLKDLQPPSENWLQGYLFPDTYEFIQDSKQPVYEVINVMLNNFDNKYDEKIQQGADELGLSVQEVVTIASLIEREAKVEEEFAKIAGVIINRLNNSVEYPYLQIDASLQYAVGHNNKLTDAEKNLDSPYNLYKHKGLPPTPICNPGYNALYAATHPDQHHYYYYVAMPDGTHLFAQTNSQHNQNRIRAEKAWEQAE